MRTHQVTSPFLFHRLSFLPKSGRQHARAIALPSLAVLLILQFAFPVLSARGQTGQWLWVAGSNVSGQAGVYGLLNTTAGTNSPGSRTTPSTWVDSHYNFWLFGGEGLDANGVNGYLNDLWMFDYGADQWTWMGGSSSVPTVPPPIGGFSSSGCGQPGVYGTLGTPAAENIPGGRVAASTWTDASGNLWLFGGDTCQGNMNVDPLNDLWEFSPANNEWAWMGGSGTLNQPGVYGTLGTPTATNVPGARYSASFSTDASGHFWLFGGQGIDGADRPGFLNDLWEFDPVANAWTWVAGSNSNSQPGTYGVLGTPAAANSPGGRFGAASWIDANGRFWLFSGQSVDANGVLGFPSDLWQFDPSIQEWTWMGGNNSVSSPGGGQSGVYGTLGMPVATNIPGGRLYAVTWVDASGSLWLFGGVGLGAIGQGGELNDLWEFDPSTNEWTWMGGSDSANSAGSYGAMGILSAGSLPGGRSSSAGWLDALGNPWVFGGFGYDSNAQEGWLNDLWQDQLPSAATPTFSPQGGQYTSPQTVTISSSTPGSAFFFTTDNSSPTPRSNRYTSPILVSKTQTIQAMAAAPGFANSFAWGLYIINTAPPDPPVFIPPPGVYIQSVDVTLFDDSNGAKIYYNLGGSPPDSNSTPYTGPIHITTNTTVSAIAYIGELASGVIGGEYDINGPPAEIPAFDPPAGPYKSIQSVTLSDSTPGATIYFTTDGSHPTVSSTPYTTPIAVASSETIEAIAVAPGYSTSAIGAAQYTLNLPPPAFALGANAGSLTINSGGQGNVTLTVTPQNGFNSAVTFACSGQPSSVTCSFNPATVTPAGSAGTTTLTFAAAASASAQHSRNPLLPAATLALAACAFLRMRRHNLRNLLLLLIFAISLETLTACGGGGRNSGRGGGGGSTTATVTVTATSGSLQQTTTISLTLN